MVAVFVVAGCGGTGGRSAMPSVTGRDEGPSRLPPIYPGTTVSIPPSSSSTSASTSVSAGPVTKTIPGDGTFKVGVDIQPGTYRSEGGESCYWERLRGLNGSYKDIIANGAGNAPQVVRVEAGDVAFKTQHCAVWTLQAPGAATTTTSSSKAPVALPPGAQVCPPSGGPSGAFAQSATGSPGTTCPFAEQVRQAYGASGPASSTPRQVEAVSPVTGQHYTMTCAANGSLVTCSGGNDAVVYLY